MRGVKPGRASGIRVVSLMAGSLSYMPPRGYPRPAFEHIGTIKAWVKGGAANTTNSNTVT